MTKITPAEQSAWQAGVHAGQKMERQYAAIAQEPVEDISAWVSKAHELSSALTLYGLGTQQRAKARDDLDKHLRAVHAQPAAQLSLLQRWMSFGRSDPSGLARNLVADTEAVLTCQELQAPEVCGAYTRDKPACGAQNEKCEGQGAEPVKHPSYDPDCCQGHKAESDCKCARYDAAAPVAAQDQQPVSGADGLLGASKFRKRPVVIEAVQIGKRMDLTSPDWWAEAVQQNRVILRGMGKFTRDLPMVEISTPEGVMTGQQGDWIIRGVQGELYPCKPDIFAATYERAQPQLSGNPGQLDEREAFEAWAATQSDSWLIVGGLTWSPGTNDYASARTNAAFAAWQARAALQSQDREDAVRFRKIINMTRAEREEVLFFPEDKDVIKAIDHARRAEGES